MSVSSINEPINRIREACFARGSTGLRDLGRMFNLYDEVYNKRHKDDAVEKKIKNKISVIFLQCNASAGKNFIFAVVSFIAIGLRYRDISPIDIGIVSVV
jgi:hypothetical protein